MPTDRRFPDARLLFTGCGTSFHAAQTGGEAVQALELVLRPDRDADVLVCVSHEGKTILTLEAAQAWPGETWLVTADAESPLADGLRRGRRLRARARGELVPHGELHGGRGDARRAPRRGRVVAAEAVEAMLGRAGLPVSDHERWLVAGAGRDWPTAQEAVLKLREGAYVAAEALRDGAAPPRVPRRGGRDGARAFVLEGEGRAAARAHDAEAALRALGVDVTLVPTRHPVVDIVPFQRLTADLAAAPRRRSRSHPPPRRALGQRRRRSADLARLTSQLAVRAG